jgi:hypothetical protein
MNNTRLLPEKAFVKRMGVRSVAASMHGSLVVLEMAK